VASIDDSFVLGELFDEALQALPSAAEDPGSADIVDRIITDDLPPLLKPLTTSQAVEVRGSTRTGTRAAVPWVGVFPAGDTSAKTGMYLVYLFAADGSRVYLSLIQGTEQVGRLTTLRKRSIDLRRVTHQPDETTTNIALGSVLIRPRRYEAATAFAYEYRAGEMPSDHVFTVHLQEMLTAYSEAIAANVNLGPVETTHLLVKWNPAKGPQALTAHREVAAAHGATWWGVMSSRARVLSESNVKRLKEQIDTDVETHAYLYGGEQVWRTRLLDVTEDTSEIDEGLRPSYYSTAECRLFLKLVDFQQLAPTWPLENLVLANFASDDPDVLARGLGNQTSPIQVYELIGAEPVVIEETDESSVPELTIDWLRKRTLLDEDFLDELIAAVGTTSPQVVFVGPPGTSKTWVARAVARYLTQDRPFAHRIVQFHATYGYEEFIEGLRPVAQGGAIVFDRVDGVVLQMVEEMEDDEDLKVLVIDEMNRANLPRVFGELMYLFEYRDEPIDLLYTKSFRLPSGMRFVGTMNSADRSIRSLDTALRRRFDVFEMPPSRSILERFYEDASHNNQIATLFDGFDALNARLTDLVDRHHTIGHSFFMAEEMNWQRLREVWERKIGPLIEEYFFDQPDLAEEFALEEFFGTP
jgi:5-methylcytosine-specific restriction protein B